MLIALERAHDRRAPGEQPRGCGARASVMHDRGNAGNSHRCDTRSTTMVSVPACKSLTPPHPVATTARLPAFCRAAATAAPTDRCGPDTAAEADVDRRRALADKTLKLTVR